MTSLVMLSVTGAVLLGACSPAGSGAKPSPGRQASTGTVSSAAVSGLSPTSAVTSPAKGGASPGTLSDMTEPTPTPYVALKPSPGAPPLDFGQPIASMERVLNNHGRQRVDGETAARDMAKLLLDSRTSRSGEEVLGLISSPTLPVTTRANLIWDYDRSSTRGANLQRYCEPAAGAYARSSYQGPASQPTRVSVNFACFVRSDRIHIGAWYITSYDVEPSQSGSWQLAEAGFGKAPIGVLRINMTAAEKSELLVGPGWRRLSP
jgi:hypothetical protein